MSDSAAKVKTYYKKIVDVNIGTVAEELLGTRITDKSDRLLQVDCPHHDSKSHRSLHVMLDKQGWYCFGCGKGGDVLQLVEFVQSGEVTAGVSGAMPESHRKARDYLAEKAGIPPLSSFGLPRDGLERTEQDLVFEYQTKDVATELARLYHNKLKSNPKVLEWVKTQYAISDDMIDQLLIGFADNNACEGSPSPLTVLQGKFPLRIRW